MPKVERFVGFMYHATQGFEVSLGLRHYHRGLPISSSHVPQFSFHVGYNWSW